MPCGGEPSVVPSVGPIVASLPLSLEIVPHSARFRALTHYYRPAPALDHAG
jgi:hypothetical protein